MKNNTYLTSKEAQAYLKISKATLYRYISAGKITPSKLIGKVLFSKASLDEALQPCDNKPTLN